MTKIKLCGLSQLRDIEIANQLAPEYVGFVFAGLSKRYVSPEQAGRLKKHLNPSITAVGVFVNETPEEISKLLNLKIIDMAQLHGQEDEDYIKALRSLTDKPIIKAFAINTEEDVIDANKSTADYVLLDSGNGGSGRVFDWVYAKGLLRPYFLAGGLSLNNIDRAIKTLGPYAVDVSSGIETDGQKDIDKMGKFVHIVRGKDEIK
ncbi:MAG TPA: phosphoribosylanthranilate isomerase [Clostridiales bacterium]|nr:phosphoribosylanthranilate isomerase [Clostridiales bacterium]